MKIPKITKLNVPELLVAASHMPHFGKLAISKNRLLYLDINDDYILKLFPLLKNSQINMPDYFGINRAGAHISVIYPEEIKSTIEENLNKEYHFNIREMIIAEIGLKKYYALMVESTSLVHLRQKYFLPDKLCFKGYEIGFHITIGIGL